MYTLETIPGVDINIFNLEQAIRNWKTVSISVPIYLLRTTTEARFANSYCSRVGGKVRGWAKLCTCLMGNVWLITWGSFANRACSPLTMSTYSIKAKVHPSTILPRHQALIFDPPSLDFREQ